MRKTSFYWPDDLHRAIQREAARSGVSVSEYIRQSLIVRLTWAHTMRLVLAGADPNVAVDIERFDKALRILAREMRE